MLHLSFSFLLLTWNIFPKHMNGWCTCNMIYGTLYVLCLPKAYKVNIWTLAWFNEQNFSEISPKLYSMGYLSGLVKALCCLLIGPHWTEEAQRQTHACACTQTHTHAPSPQRRPLSSSPRGNDDSHYRLKARWPQCPYSAALLSYQTALLYWCSIISFPLSFRVHQGVVVLWGRDLESGKTWTWKCTAGWNYSLLWLENLWDHCWAVFGPADTFPSLIV